LAYEGLGNSYVILGQFRQLSPERAYRPAKDALSKALELDNCIGRAHVMLAVLSWRYDWNRAAAEREYNYALALAPSDAWAHASYSYYLALTGRRAEAFAELTRSRELDPSNSFAIAESCVYYLLRDYEGLIEASRRGVVSDPNEWIEHYHLGVGYEGTGRRLEAIPEYRKAAEMSDGDQDATAAPAHAYAVLGRRAEAEKILEELERRSKIAYVSPYMIAAIYAGLGNKDKAFEFLEKAYRERCWDIVGRSKLTYGSTISALTRALPNCCAVSVFRSDGFCTLIDVLKELLRHFSPNTDPKRPAYSRIMTRLSSLPPLPLPIASSRPWKSSLSPPLTSLASWTC
jgi:tetratricopeptide (TPR) repeat protein